MGLMISKIGGILGWLPAAARQADIAKIGQGELDEFPDLELPNQSDEDDNCDSGLCTEMNELVREARKLIRLQHEWKEKATKHQNQLEASCTQQNTELSDFIKIFKDDNFLSPSVEMKLKRTMQHYEKFRKMTMEFKQTVCDGKESANVVSTEVNAGSNESPTQVRSISDADSSGVVESAVESQEMELGNSREAGIEKRKKLKAIRLTTGKSPTQNEPLTEAHPGESEVGKFLETVLKAHGYDGSASASTPGKVICICGVSCKSMKAHRRHVEYVTNHGKFKCRFCRKSYLYYGHLKQHEIQTHKHMYDANPRSDGEVGCRKCGEMFESRSQILLHQKRDHSNTEAAIMSESMEDCPSTPANEDPPRPGTSMVEQKRKKIDAPKRAKKIKITSISEEEENGQLFNNHAPSSFTG